MLPFAGILGAVPHFVGDLAKLPKIILFFRLFAHPLDIDLGMEYNNNTASEWNITGALEVISG